MAWPLSQLALALALELGLAASLSSGHEPGEPGDPATQRDSLLLLTPAPGPETSPETAAIIERAAAAIRAHLGGSGLTLEPRPGPPGSAGFAAQLSAAREHGAGEPQRAVTRPRAVFWIDLRTPKVALIYLLDPRAGRIFERSVDLDPASSEASIEALALIVSASGQALTSGEELMMREVDAATVAAAEAEVSAPEPSAPSEAETVEPASPVNEAAPPGSNAPAPAPAPAQATPPPRRPQLTRTFAVAYLGESFSSTSPWQSGLLASFELGVGPRASLGAQYGFLAPTRLDASAPQPLSVTQHDLSLTTGIGDRVIPRLTLAGRLGATIGFARWRAEGSDLGGTRVMAKAALEVLARIYPRPELGVALDLGVAAVAVLNNFDYVLCPPTQATCTLDQAVVAESPWPVRPRAWLGVSYRF